MNDPFVPWSEELFRLILGNLPIVVWEQDKSLRYRWIYNSSIGFDNKAVVGKRDIDLMPRREDAERIEALKRQVLTTGIGLRQEVTVFYDGRLRHYDLTIAPIRDDDQITGLNCAALDMSSYKEAEAALARSVQTTHLLHEAAQYLGETLDPEKVYDRLHELLSAVVPHDGLVVSSYDPETNLIRCEYAWVDGNKLDATSLPSLPLNVKGEGMQSRVIHTGQSLLLNNVGQEVQSKDGTFYDVDAEGNMRKVPDTGPPATRAAIMTPVKLQGQVVGVAQVMSDQITYTQAQLELVEGIVAQVSAAVRNAKLYEAAQREITERKKAEETLRRERELLQKIFDRIPVMIAMYGPDTRVLQLNREFERLTGWTTAEARQVNLMEKCYPDPRYREEVLAYMKSLQEGWKDLEMTTKQGQVLDSSWSNIQLSDDTQIGIGIDIRYRRQAEAEREQLLAALERERMQLKALNETLEQQVQERTAEVRQLAAALTQAEQQERRQLARDLHDSAGQSLTALQIYLKLIENEIPEALDSLRQKMAEAKRLVQEVHDEIRAISHAMRPPALNHMGLQVTLQELCQDFTRRTGLRVDYQGDELPSLPDQLSINFYRFLQEALTNAAKHAQADTIQVNLSYQNGNLVLSVQDNGVGFASSGEPLPLTASGGIGLQSLQERFHLLGGQVEIDSQPGEGTRLVAWCRATPL